MKVEKVSANIRYSQDTGKGAWKVIELGAEGSVGAEEQWQAAQRLLYAELGKQLKALWVSGTGITTQAFLNTENQGDELNGAGSFANPS